MSQNKVLNQEILLTRKTYKILQKENSQLKQEISQLRVSIEEMNANIDKRSEEREEAYSEHRNRCEMEKEEIFVIVERLRNDIESLSEQLKQANLDKNKLKIELKNFRYNDRGEKTKPGFLFS